MKSLSRHIRTLHYCAMTTLFACLIGTAHSSPVNCAFETCPYASSNPAIASIDNMTESITKGIEESVIIVKPVYDSRVKSYLKTYIERYPKYTERIIALSEVYFPLFEEYLKAYGMPTDLKYLAIVESGLQPSATSTVGAAGLWQFMSGTGKEFDLRINKYLDERRDPKKSTEAAVKYLKQLYERFGSWELAMAGYNAGPGRVNYAIKKSGSTDYWKLQRYLPRETRSYVPGFIAVNYLLTHYSQHGLKAAELPTEYTQTAVINIFEGLSFQDINQATGVSTTTLAELNPKFTRRYIPGSVMGYELLMPTYGIAPLLAHLDVAEEDVAKYTSVKYASMPTAPIAFESRTEMHSYRVSKGDNLYRIAQNNGCSVDDLMRWNNLSSSNLQINQRLKIRVTESVAIYPEENPSRSIDAIAMLESKSAVSGFGKQTLKIPELNYQPVVHYRPDFPEEAMILKRRMSIKDLMAINDIPATMLPKYSALTPGAVVTLK